MRLIGECPPEGQKVVADAMARVRSFLGLEVNCTFEQEVSKTVYFRGTCFVACQHFIITLEMTVSPTTEYDIFDRSHFTIITV